MTFLYILLALIIIIALLLITRIGVAVSYKDKLTVDIKVGFIRYRIVGNEKVKLREKKGRTVKKTRTKKKKSPQEKSDEKKHSPSDIIKLLKDVIRPLTERFIKYLRIDKYDISLKVATGDAATTAILFGAASGALHSLTAILKTLKPRKKKGVYMAEVVPDFLGEDSSVEASITMSILVWQAMVCAISGGSGFLKYYGEKAKKAQNIKTTNERTDSHERNTD